MRGTYNIPFELFIAPSVKMMTSELIVFGTGVLVEDILKQIDERGNE